MELISFLIPVYNSQDTIGLVCEEIIKSVNERKEEYDYEIILVNDGSKDKSEEVCLSLTRSNEKIKFIQFSKNFGKHHAMMAGFRATAGKYIICLDDDLQNPPNEIWKLIDKLIQDKLDVVYGKPIVKKHSMIQNIGSLINKKMAELLLNKPKTLYTSSFLVLKDYVAKEICRYTNAYAYIDGLIFRATDKIDNVEVTHREREVGKSNFNFLKLIQLWLNGFTSFSVKPLRIATGIGLILGAISIIAMAVLFIQKIVNPQIKLGYTSIMMTVVFFGSIQLVAIGLLGEYIGRIYIALNKSPQYLVKEVVHVKDDKLKY